jgi:hypothetical protein
MRYSVGAIKGGDVTKPQIYIRNIYVGSGVNCFYFDEHQIDSLISAIEGAKKYLQSDPPNATWNIPD